LIPIREFAGREVALFGLARSGLAATRALVAGGARVCAWDDNPASRAAAAEIGVSVEDFNARDWRNFAALVLSPGVPLYFPKPHRMVEMARSIGVPVLGDVELFARAVNALALFARPKVIGVTGTNGKSTTTALIGHILKEAGRDVRVGGNIGTGVLDLEPLHAGAHYVLELSSFQLDLTDSLRCAAAVFLNLTPDHLDRHGNMQNYLAAKKRIFHNQGAGDWAIVGVDDAAGQQTCTELISAGRQVAPISAGQALGRGVSAIGGKLYDALGGRPESFFELARAEALPGRHNAQNIAAAYAAARVMGLAPQEIAQGIKSFPGLAHRLERCGEADGVRFVNDSKATNADAAAQALAAYERVYWIAGGKPKDGGIEALAKFFPKIAKAYLIGEAAGDFAKSLDGRAPYAQCGTMEKAVAQAFRDARGGADKSAIVLLSPACASFDQFRDFEERGDRFKALAAEIVETAKPRTRA
jgi:UDP-N-acetylmuramoylalanine--D-glutamate ligase